MSAPQGNFAPAYAAALRGYLLRSGEQALHDAYELGRQALSQGLGLLDITLLHHKALTEILQKGGPSQTGIRLELAADFLAECLSPFEMTLLGYKEANSALVNAHERLRAEMEERRKAEQALLHAMKLQAVGLLAGGVAHHFNNLLTVVLGNLDLARRHVQDERVTRMLRAAEQGAEHGAQITRHLLSFSRQQMLQPANVDVASWLEEIGPLLAGSLRGDIVVETDIQGHVGQIHIDRSQLDLAILNLAVNARDAMPTGGTLRISASPIHINDGRLGLNGDFIVIEVADTGGGIPPDVLPQVFEPFFTTKNERPGTGLGLSQVHGFTHQSGGGVELFSRPGEGTTVRLYLPLAPNDASPVSADQDTVQNGSGRVLIVEDDENVAGIASDLLRSFGYSVHCAYRAQAALDLLRKGELVDLVFSDVLMPDGMDGFELAEEIRRAFPTLPILLTSGYNDAIKTLQDKGAEFIVKPYRTDELKRKLHDLLDRG